MVTQAEMNLVVAQACEKFAKFLEDHRHQSDVLVLVAPIDKPEEVIAASTAASFKARHMATQFLNSTRDHSRSFWDEEPQLPPARSIRELPSVGSIDASENEEVHPVGCSPGSQVILCSPSTLVHTDFEPEPSDEPIDIRQMAAEACERIIALFEEHGLQMECFIVISPRAHPSDITAASTAPTLSTNCMIRKFIRASGSRWSDEWDDQTRRLHSRNAEGDPDE
jgi:hypothetical protein